MDGKHARSVHFINLRQLCNRMIPAQTALGWGLQLAFGNQAPILCPKPMRHSKARWAYTLSHF